MRVLIKRALGLGKRNGPVIKTLIDRFRYPLHGPGEMWEELAKTIQSRGAAPQNQQLPDSLQRFQAPVYLCRPNPGQASAPFQSY